MADLKACAGGDVVCNDRCGCPSPCPGGVTCRGMTTETAGGTELKRCLCGEYCGCNPCTCREAEAEVPGQGNNFVNAGGVAPV